MNDLFGEQMLAVIRLAPFLGGDHPKVTRAMHAEAARLPKLMRQELRAFFNGEALERPTKPPPFEYLKLVEQLSRPIQQQDIETMVGAHQEPQDAVDVYVAVTRALAFLSGACPRRAKQTLTGAVQLVPSDQEVERFRRLFVVVDEPLTVLYKLRRLSLLADEVGAFATVYPAMYEMLGKLVQEELAAAKTRGGMKWHLPEAKERQLMLLLQMSPSDKDLVKDMQATFGDEGKESDQGPAAPKPSKIDLKASSLQTVAQGAEAGARR